METFFKTSEPIVQITACMAAPSLILEGASSQLYTLGFSKDSGVTLEEVHFEFNQNELWYKPKDGAILIVQGDYDEYKQRLRLELIQEQNKSLPVCTAHFWKVFSDHWLDFSKINRKKQLIEARKVDLLEHSQTKI